MNISTLDWAIIGSFFLIVLAVGVWTSKTSGKNTSEFFLSGKSMPWWLLGFSMVATTFAADTPLLVTDIVRGDGVAGNWVWWAFLITGMLTVFVYAKLWRKSNVNTDMEFYELRYGGRAAEFLRGFRSVYLGLIFNVLVMSVVALAAIKIGGIMLGLTPMQVILSTSIVIVVFSAIGGFRGVVYTDFILFTIAMIGAFGAAYYIVNLPEVGGLSKLMSNSLVMEKAPMLPDFSNKSLLIKLLIVPLAVQWWSAWYPGAEPGGGGYIAQRMLAAKDENHAIGATFFFNIMHYAIRPWPWILVALASLVIFPDLQSLQSAFPNVPADKIGHDLAYPAMLNYLPHGLLGIVLASLMAAYMSTISTHLNWGSSYVVNDFYRRFVKKDASEKELVNVGRVSTVLMMFLSAVFALNLQNVKQIFDIVILFGAGTGLIFLLRWFWWRVNAWSEISAMFASGIISVLFNFTQVGRTLFGYSDGTGVHAGMLEDWTKFPLVVLITTIIWLVVTFLTPPEKQEVLERFYKKIQPDSTGWKKVIEKAKVDGRDVIDVSSGNSHLPTGIMATIVGTLLVYFILFAIGNFLYGKMMLGVGLASVAGICAFVLIKLWTKIRKGLVIN